MKHIQVISSPTGKAYGIGIGEYLLVAGQILGILALTLTGKSTEEDTTDESSAR